MFLFYVVRFFKKGDTIQGGHYLRKYGISFTFSKNINHVYFQIAFVCQLLSLDYSLDYFF